MLTCIGVHPLVFARSNVQQQWQHPTLPFSAAPGWLKGLRVSLMLLNSVMTMNNMLIALKADAA